MQYFKNIKIYSLFQGETIKDIYIDKYLNNQTKLHLNNFNLILTGPSWSDV